MNSSRLVRPSFRESNVSRSSTASGKRTDFLFSSILTIYPSLRADDNPEPTSFGRMPRGTVIHVAVSRQFRKALVVGGDGAYPREAHELAAAGVEMAIGLAAIVVAEQCRHQSDVRGQQTPVIPDTLKECAERV